MSGQKRSPRSGAAGSGATAELPRKKNFRLHQSKIDRAMKVLGTRTETETIEQALDLVTFGDAVIEGIEAMYGSGLQNVIDEPPEEQPQKSEIGVELEQAIGKLSPAYRQAIILRHIHDLPYEQIAELMALPVGTVKTYVHRGRRELHEMLEHVTAS
ncbi:MAG TPA: RNA polymerase sigma factor [Longimicrobium sp.]